MYKHCRATRLSRIVRIAVSAMVGITMVVVGSAPARATAGAPKGNTSVMPAGDVHALAYVWWANNASGRCLTSQNTGNGSPAFTYDCWGGVDQNWQLEWQNSSYFLLRNEASGRCLTSQNLGNGAPAFTYDCWNGADQRWSTYLYNGYRVFRNYASGRCLTSQNTGNGSRAFTYDCWGGADQLWY